MLLSTLVFFKNDAKTAKGTEKMENPVAKSVEGTVLLMRFFVFSFFVRKFVSCFSLWLILN